VAVPVGASETCAFMGRIADEVVCVSMPEPLNAVGLWYDDFSQTSDEDVTRLLERAAGGSRPSMPARPSVPRTRGPYD
jgi:predicted phosphoribosyltransferase